MSSRRGATLDRPDSMDAPAALRSSRCSRQARDPSGTWRRYHPSAPSPALCSRRPPLLQSRRRISDRRPDAYDRACKDGGLKRPTAAAPAEFSHRTVPLVRRLVGEFLRPHLAAHGASPSWRWAVMAAATAANAWLMQPMLDRVFVARDERLLLVIPAAVDRPRLRQGRRQLRPVGADDDGGPARRRRHPVRAVRAADARRSRLLPRQPDRHADLALHQRRQCCCAAPPPPCSPGSARRR